MINTSDFVQLRALGARIILLILFNISINSLNVEAFLNSLSTISPYPASDEFNFLCIILSAQTSYQYTFVFDPNWDVHIDLALC